MKISHILHGTALIGGGLTIGILISGYENPSARIITNVDAGTILNHGQKSIYIELPHGVKFTSFGQCGPHWQADASAPHGISWTSMVCNVEKFDTTIDGFRVDP